MKAFSTILISVFALITEPMLVLAKDERVKECLACPYVYTATFAVECPNGKRPSCEVVCSVARVKSEVDACCVCVILKLMLMLR